MSGFIMGVMWCEESAIRQKISRKYLVQWTDRITDSEDEDEEKRVLSTCIIKRTINIIVYKIEESYMNLHTTR